MAIDITNDNRKAWEALRNVKDFCSRVAKKRAIYSAHVNGTIMCSTDKDMVKEFVASQTPKGQKMVREISFAPLNEVDRLRRKMPLGEVIKKLGLEMTVNSLKVQLINAGFIKTNKSKMEERRKRNEKIKRLYNQGYSFSMIKDSLSLALAETTIERICRDWDL